MSKMLPCPDTAFKIWLIKSNLFVTELLDLYGGPMSKANGRLHCKLAIR